MRDKIKNPAASLNLPDNQLYGSDLIAEALREQRFPYICLNPGASYRGLHDSLVNHLGNQTPEIITCMHEEHAVGIAQGYAKITDKALAVAVHSNVGLMHASMGVFNAWCDRVPMLILGATGPLDAANVDHGLNGSTQLLIRVAWYGALPNGTISLHLQWLRSSLFAEV